MEIVTFSTAAFSWPQTRPVRPSAIPVTGSIPTSSSRLAHAAATVGCPPPGVRIGPRPLLELAWRRALVRANLASAGTF